MESKDISGILFVQELLQQMKELREDLRARIEAFEKKGAPSPTEVDEQEHVRSTHRMLCEDMRRYQEHLEQSRRTTDAARE